MHKFIARTKYLIVILLVTTSFSLFGQIQVADSETKSPIAFLQIVSKSGRFVSSSDLNGKIEAYKIVDKSMIDDSITFFHLSYENKTLLVKSISDSDTILLKRKEILIPEVTVSIRKNESTFTVLRGYYRSYQTEDGLPKYFSDGIVEYYIGKNSFKNRLIESRSFRNQDLIESQKKRNISVSVVIAGVPYIYENTAYKELGEDVSTNLTGGKNLILKDNSVVGEFTSDKSGGISILSIDGLAPKGEVIHTIFNYTQKLVKILYTEKYTKQSLDSITKDDLQCRKEYRKILYKHKKDKDFVEIDGFSEFYVLEVKQVTKSELKGIDLSSFFGLNEFSNYSNEYWTDLDMYKIEKLPNTIESILNTQLIMYK